MAFKMEMLSQRMSVKRSVVKMEDATAMVEDVQLSHIYLQRGGVLATTVCSHLSTICIIVYDIWIQWHMVILSPIVLLFILPGFILILLYGTALFLHIYQHKRRQIYDAYASNFWEGAQSSVAAFYDAQATLWHDSFEFTCELDEYAFLKKELQESGIVKDLRSGLKSYKNSFHGKEAVDFLVKTKNLDRGHAIEMCKQLVEKHFGKSVKDKGQLEFRDDETIYRFLEDDQTNALNSEINSDCEPRGAAEVGEELRKLILSIYNSHLSADGKKVDYRAIGESTEFKQYQKHTAELKRVDVENATRQEKLAFFINVYNALVIHAFVTRGPPTNLWQRYKFFNVVSYVLGGHVYSLNDIENGILRSNRKPLGSLRKPFSKSDPRLSIALPEPEPKVHFALVCGAKSCPPIKTYNSKEVDNQLKLAAESFLEGDDVAVDMVKREVRISQILKWCKEDFGKTKHNIVKWIMTNMGECEKKRQLTELLESNNFKLAYFPYDWGLNS